MMLRSAQTLTFILILFVSALPAQTPALPTGVERVATVEAITEYRLANGPRAVLVPDASKSTTTVNITDLAGSRHENYGETGMAHIIEHLVSFGSLKHPGPSERSYLSQFRVEPRFHARRTSQLS
jgi:zinc protease